MKKTNLFTPIILVFDGNYIHKTICKHLMNQGICSMKELCLQNEESLRGFKGIKDKSIESIKSILDEHGLHLGMDERELAVYAKDMPSFQFPKKANNQPKIDWEQRRYEIARGAYLQLFNEILDGKIDDGDAAVVSVRHAESLILELQTKCIKNQ